MLTEIIFFGLSLCLGLLSGFLHLLFSALFKKLSNRAAAITVQFLLGGSCICAFTLLAFFINDGKFTFYAVAALIIGFAATLIIIQKRA